MKTEVPARYELWINQGTRSARIEVEAERLTLTSGDVWLLDGKPIAVDGFEVVAWKRAKGIETL